MKKYVVVILSLFAQSVYSQLPDLEKSTLVKNNVKLVSEWKYAMESDGTKYESSKLKSRIFNRIGDPIEDVFHDGLYSISEEKAVYQYDQSGILVEWIHYIDTTIWKHATYEYDSLSRKTLEIRKDKFESIPIEISYLYGFDEIQQTKEETAVCEVCYLHKIRRLYGMNGNLNCILKYNENDSIINEVRFSYNTQNQLIKEEAFSKHNCSNCLDYHVLYEYNSNGQLISETHFSQKNNFERKFIYEYDPSGLNTRTLRTYRNNERTIVSLYEFYQ